MSSLRLFPLNIVLFPGMELPLHVFEPRYRQLVVECLTASEPFGVALIREGSEVGGGEVGGGEVGGGEGGAAADPHELGTTARIDSAIPLPGDRMFVKAAGERRFRIISLHHDRPYLRAEVEYPVDEHTEASEDVVRSVTEAYRKLVQLRLAALGGYERSPPVPDSPGALADLAAAATAGSVPVDRLQAVLETLDVRRRLDLTAALLTSALEAAHRETGALLAQRWTHDRRN